MEQKGLQVSEQSGPMTAKAMEQVLLGGDLSKLTALERMTYYSRVCESVGLNPLTRPFEYIVLNQRMTLYARKDATDQLRRINGVSIDDIDLQETATHYKVKVKGHDKTGRSDCELGIVAKSDMRGDVGNAQMKAVTKAKRRLTLSLCGLGWLDETEVETIPDAKPVTVAESGEIVKPVKTAPVAVDKIGPDVIITLPGKFNGKKMGEVPAYYIKSLMITTGKASEFSELFELAISRGMVEAEKALGIEDDAVKAHMEKTYGKTEWLALTQEERYNVYLHYGKMAKEAQNGKKA